jgi:hypothetical protein
MDLNKKSFIAFSKETLIQEEGSSVSIKDIMQSYREWIRYNPSPKVLQKADIIALMSEMYGPLDVTYGAFSNVRIMSEEEKELISMKEELIRELAALDVADAEEKRAITAAEQAKDLARYLDQQAFLATRKTVRARAKYQDLHTEIAAKESLVKVLCTAVKEDSHPKV